MADQQHRRQGPSRQGCILLVELLKRTVLTLSMGKESAKYDAVT
jgi:hypothetical protein